MRAAALAIIAALCAGAGPALADRGPGKSGVYERSRVEVAPAANVRINAIKVDNRLGNVTLEGHDEKGIVILAYKRALDNDTLDRLKVKLVPDPSGPVNISTSLAAGRESRPIPAGSIRIDLVIRAPRGAQVMARVWNGKVAVKGMNNGAELSANRGDLKVENTSGKVVTRTMAGRLDVHEVVGDVDAQGINGELRFELVRGSHLNATVHKGDIVGRKISSRQVTMRATHGDIVLQGHAVIGSRYSIATYRGDVEVRLAGAPAFVVWAKAAKGAVSLPESAQSRATSGDAVTAELNPGARGTAFVRLQARLGEVKFRLVK